MRVLISIQYSGVLSDDKKMSYNFTESNQCTFIEFCTKKSKMCV